MASVEVYTPDGVHAGSIETDIRDWTELNHACKKLSIVANGYPSFEHHSASGTNHIVLADLYYHNTEWPKFMDGDKIIFGQWREVRTLQIDVHAHLSLVRLMTSNDNIYCRQDQDLRIYNSSGITPGLMTTCYFNKSHPIPDSLQMSINGHCTYKNTGMILATHAPIRKVTVVDHSLTIYM